MLDWNQSNDVIYNLCLYRSLSDVRGVFYADLDLVWDAERVEEFNPSWRIVG